jgi:hypothetical protein
MAAKSEHEYRGWTIRITGHQVGIDSSAMIEVWKPGLDPRSETSVVVPFHQRVPSEAEAQAVALQAAKKWIDRAVASGGSPTV